ncbi:unnamed protein product, partial [Acidithrix sp. C25]
VSLQWALKVVTSHRWIDLFCLDSVSNDDGVNRTDLLARLSIGGIASK